MPVADRLAPRQSSAPTLARTHARQLDRRWSCCLPSTMHQLPAQDLPRTPPPEMFDQLSLVGAVEAMKLAERGAIPAGDGHGLFGPNTRIRRTSNAVLTSCPKSHSNTLYAPGVDGIRGWKP